MLEYFSKQLDVPSHYDLCVLDLSGKSTVLAKNSTETVPEWSQKKDGLYVIVGKERIRIDP